MAADDQGDQYAEIRRLRKDVDRLMSGSMLENSSITRGRMRFIGGTLRVDSGGRVEIVGTLSVDGTSEFVGPMTITGDVDLEGTMTVTDGSIVIDGGNRIRLATNDAGIAALSFQSGAQITSSGATVIVSDGDGTLIGVGDGVVGIQADEINLTSLPALPSGTGASYVVIGTDGALYKASGAGGGGGDPGDPPQGNPDGYIWAADPAVYGISDTFAAHVARGSAEPGVDVMTPIGTPIWAPGDGTIVDVQTSYAGATGAYVTLVTDAGDWFRFLHNSQVVVSVGQTVQQTDLLAYSGGSGFGEPVYYGPHSHQSFAPGFTGTWPGAGALRDLQAYMASA